MKPHPLFNQSKYTRWYYAIIQKRAITDRRRRHEVHHILPQSLGGGDEPENLVRLSGHDHAWCHWLLTKMTSGEDRSKMIYAFRMMEVQGEHMERQSSYAIVRAYERNRLEWSKTHSEKMKGKEPWNKGLDMKDDPRCKGGRKNKNRVKTEKEKTQRIITMKANGNDKRTQATKDKMSVSQTGIPKPKDAAFRAQVSKTLTGKPKRDGHGDAVAAANRGVISVHKDDVEKKIKKETLQSWLDQGWTVGGRLRKIGMESGATKLKRNKIKYHDA
jgi:hypothetical protein